MSIGVLTLQPDHRGRINNTRQSHTLFEAAQYPLAASTTTEERQLVANYGGRGRTCVARHVVGDDTAITDAAMDVKMGPLAVPFMQHLFGENRHGFCADTRIVVATSTELTLKAHDMVSFSGWEADLSIPIITAFDSAKPVHGVVRGLIEDNARRVYYGTDGDSAISTKSVYVVQVMGVVKVFSDVSGVSFGDAVKCTSTEKEVKLTGTATVGVYLGDGVADDPDDRSDEVSYIMLTQDPTVATDPAPYHFQIIEDTGYVPSGSERRVKLYSGLVKYLANEWYPADGATNAATSGSIAQIVTSKTTIAAGATQYWWIELTGGPPPTSIVFAVDSSRPTPSAKIFMLGVVVNTAGVLTIDQEWTGGNIRALPLGAYPYQALTWDDTNDMWIADWLRFYVP